MEAKTHYAEVMTKISIVGINQLCNLKFKGDRILVNAIVSKYINQCGGFYFNSIRMT